MKDDDRLLDKLGKTAKDRTRSERGALDERWDRLSAGTLSAAEREALRREAGESAEKAAAWEAFQPLGADFSARLADRIRDQMSVETASGAAAATPAAAPVASTPAEARAGSGTDSRGDSGAETGADSGADSGAEPQTPSAPEQRAGGGNVVALRRPRRTTWLPMALAASVLAVFGASFFLPNGESLAPLPGYSVTLEGTTGQVRGETPVTAGRRAFATGNRFYLLLTPDTAAGGPLAVRLSVQRNGDITPLATPAVRSSDEGAVLVEGIVGTDILLPAGDSELLIAVGHEPALPDAAGLAVALGDAATVRADGWSGWRLPIRVD